MNSIYIIMIFFSFAVFAFRHRSTSTVLKASSSAHFHRGYADNTAAVNWEHVDHDISFKKIDWSAQSQACKIAYLALSCAQSLEICGIDTCDDKGECCSNRRARVRRLRGSPTPTHDTPNYCLLTRRHC